MVKKMFGRWNSVLVAASCLVDSGMAQEKPVETAALVESAWKLPEGVTYERSVRNEPRPLQIHSLVIDMQRAEVSFEVVPGEDPDGDGPAEVALARPEDLAKKAGAIAAINTAAWAMLVDPETGKPGKYKVGGAADISGWVSQGQRMISPPQGGYWSVWMDGSNRISMGTISSERSCDPRGLRPSGPYRGSEEYSRIPRCSSILKKCVILEPQWVSPPMGRSSYGWWSMGGKKGTVRGSAKRSWPGCCWKVAAPMGSISMVEVHPRCGFETSGRRLHLPIVRAIRRVFDRFL